MRPVKSQYPQSYAIIKKKELTLRKLLGSDLPNAVNSRHISLHSTLNSLNGTAHHALARSNVGRKLSLKLDHSDSGILGSAIVHAVTQIAEPGLQCGRVVLLDNLGLGDDR